MKINKTTGKLVASKKTEGPYKNIPIVREKRSISETWKAVMRNKGTGKILDMNAVLK